MKNYIYSGDDTGITLLIGGVLTDVLLFKGKQVTLPEEHLYVQSLLAKHLLTEVGSIATPPAPARSEPLLPAVQRINHDKILWIYNTANPTLEALGKQAIAQYASLRDCGTAHQLGYNFGTVDGADPLNLKTTGSSTRVAIQQYVAAHQIDCILVSLGVPVTLSGAAESDTLSVMACLGRGGESYYGSGFMVSNWMDDAGPAEYIGVKSRVLPRMLRWSAGDRIPVGRLGIPMPAALHTESVTDLVALTTRALQAERTDNRNTTALFGFHTRGGVETATNDLHKEAWQVAVDYELSNRKNYVSTDSALQTAGMRATVLAAQTAERVSETWAAIKAGTATPMSYFLHLDVAFENFTTSAVVGPASSFAPQPGAVSFNWTSNGFWFVREQLKRGASVGIGAITEPYASALPVPSALLQRLAMGLCVSEALMLSMGGHAAAYGDPLYTPYKYGGLKIDQRDVLPGAKGVKGDKGDKGDAGANGANITSVPRSVQVSYAEAEVTYGGVAGVLLIEDPDPSLGPDEYFRIVLPDDGFAPLIAGGDVFDRGSFRVVFTGTSTGQSFPVEFKLAPGSSVSSFGSCIPNFGAANPIFQAAGPATFTVSYHNALEQWIIVQDSAPELHKNVAPAAETAYVPDSIGAVLGLRSLFVNKATTIAAYSVPMPPWPTDGQRFGVRTRSQITALSMAQPPDGSTVVIKSGNLLLAADGYAEWEFRMSNNTWYRVI